MTGISRESEIII